VIIPQHFRAQGTLKIEHGEMMIFLWMDSAGRNNNIKVSNSRLGD
jgi:hypothetical protein